jgi:Phospholipase_D-nuclease N-terminal
VLRLDVVKVLVGFIGVGLLIYAVIDCSRTPDEDVPASLPRTGWLVMIILLPFLGPVFWLIASRTEDGVGSPPRGSGGGTSPRAEPRGTGGGSAGTTRTRGPVGPDDDPDFLRGL